MPYLTPPKPELFVDGNLPEHLIDQALRPELTPLLAMWFQKCDLLSAVQAGEVHAYTPTDVAVAVHGTVLPITGCRVAPEILLLVGGNTAQVVDSGR